MATIKAIEGRSVHQIQSGQVIVDLCSVVKELVENSLDAGATSIDVRFKNQGLDSIEVQDNGKGISPDDYETIALKHYTSKLASYEDLTSLDTFGFRGEALSSLCALSKFHILTARAEDGAVGKRLDFEVSGKLKGATVAAAQRGTTVTIDELFYSLPVRRKELEKNIKREYGKVIGLLHAYACIGVGVRFSVSNHMPKGKKMAVFSTKANTTTKENIVNVFGSKTLLALIRLDLKLAMQPSEGPGTQSARNWSTQRTDRSMEVHVEGHISKPVFGEGRQAPDRQMFFVNSRPCALPQVSKAVNEVYKSYNVTQSPFIFANMVMDTIAYDVNVSPDKRTIMLHDQTALLEKLKEKLTELFDRTDHSVPQSALPDRKLPSYKPLTLHKQGSAASQDLLANRQAKGDLEDSEDETQDLGEASDPPCSSANGTPSRTQPSLISNWINQKTESRSDQAAKRTSPSSKRKFSGAMENPHADIEQGDSNCVGPDDETAATGRRLSVSLMYAEAARGDAGKAAVDSDQQNFDSTSPEQGATDPSTAFLDDLRPQQSPASPEAPSQSRSRYASIALEVDGEASEDDPVRRPLDNGDSIEKAQRRSSEPQIPAISTSSQKSASGPIANAFDRMRPKRTPLQTAEITVGGTTTTTVIGSDSAYKRRRIHEPKNSQSIARFGASPSLARGLRNFAAPGSQMTSDDDRHASSVRSSLPSPEDSVSEDEGDHSDNPRNEHEAPPASRHHFRTPVDESDQDTSDPIDTLAAAPADDDASDPDYVDEQEKRDRENEEVARLIQEAENAASRPTEDNLRRASQVLKNSTSRTQSTLKLMQTLDVSTANVERQSSWWSGNLKQLHVDNAHSGAVVKGELDDANAEKKLSLTVSKSDFERMIIIGQFNLGFILAIRPASNNGDQDELFIIDQHAADEKYNYERLQRTVTLQSQRLVRPKALELTAIEEEIILNNPDALKANGFEIETVLDEDSTTGTGPGNRCRLLTLPISGEKTFDVSDLEELLHLLSEAPPGSSEIPRPKKVQRMLAMRACRSSIMVGKTLTMRDMRKVVRHMGEMEKPWNCPHGRPTMRHLAGLDAWKGWMEGSTVDDDDEVYGCVTSSGETDWKAWLAQKT
ncbi:DNA mismatch repair protein MutL [Hortaea werneckii]|nr:DNA mismatch repair protein MutL [Hortaea werneckii]KAI6998046.1 DNA mismatch repair protein MutL [Hortaea werneckii]KAI7146296.1 DNA mismatch repair protein MutL [Hortaea werneckii]KAI7178480.1 DNA mismatch repair protein MutL [Hortaea werneckii]KAI7192102.1 DNA mismatch repair protein MutL [Hortaea werneckii]